MKNEQKEEKKKKKNIDASTQKVGNIIVIQC